MMRAYLSQRGVDPQRVILDETSVNTYENAQNAATVVATKGWPSDVRLVTSAMHMPRAVKVFEAAGLTVCAIPVDYLAIKNVPWWALAPQTTALSKFRKYLHEIIGTALYRHRGWIS